MTSDADRLDELVQELRALRNRTCEPKTNANHRYSRLSNAVSALLWVRTTSVEKRRATRHEPLCLSSNVPRSLTSPMPRGSAPAQPVRVPRRRPKDCAP